MGRILRIGGPNLAPPQHTWLIELLAEGSRFLPAVAVGQEFDFDSVHDAQGYVDRGQASIVESTTEAATATGPAVGPPVNLQVTDKEEV